MQDKVTTVKYKVKMIRNKISIVSNKSDNCKIESLITLESHIKIDNAENLRYKQRWKEYKNILLK